MEFTLEQLRTLANLAPLDTRGFGTGALPLEVDARDSSIGSIGSVQNKLLAGFPTDYTLESWVRMIYNQGALPACVTYSIAAMQSCLGNIDQGFWNELDPNEAYYACGGDGKHGVSTRAALDWEESTGMLFVNTGQRYKIAGDAFADPATDAGVQELKAAIASNIPCILALLLPDDFWAGDCQGAKVTQDYHQICLIGYSQDRFQYVNSWGDSYGEGGCGTMPWSFLRRPEQSHFVYAYTVTDAANMAMRTFRKVVRNTEKRRSEPRSKSSKQ